MTDLPTSYYAASANELIHADALCGEHRYDACVVGGGITGCSTALHLAQRGYRVALVEATRIAWGASGRSGGQKIAGFAASNERLVSLLGKTDARRLWDMSCEAIDYVDEQIARHGIACDLKPGHMHVALQPGQRKQLIAWQQQLQDEYQYDGLTWFEGNALRQQIDSARYCAGLLDARGGHLHPMNYTLGLASAARAAGVDIFEHTPAVRITKGNVVSVATPQGNIKCDYLALCCNAYLGELEPELRRRIMPVGTYIIATESLGEHRARALISQDVAVADMNFVLDYYRLSADHRLLFGGRVSYSTLPPANLAAAMRPRMLAVFPQLNDVKVEFSWGGFVAITINRAPDFGRIADNIFYAQGFSGHGIALTGFAGKLMAEAIAGTAERFDVFARIAHRPFPGGRLLRTPLLVLAMAYYRLRDII